MFCIITYNNLDGGQAKGQTEKQTNKMAKTERQLNRKRPCCWVVKDDTMVQILDSRIIKNPDCNAGPLTCSFVRLHRSLVCLLAYIAHSLACGKVNDSMAIFSVFFSILDHSRVVKDEKERVGERKSFPLAREQMESLQRP